MSEQDINTEETYEIPSNDMGGDKGEGGSGLVSKSSIKEVIEAASGIDPSRFWIIFMVALVIALAGVITFGGGYLVEQGKQKDKDIAALRIELKECPQKTFEDLRKQQEAIDALKSGAIYDRDRIQQIKEEKIQDLNKLKIIDNQLNKEVE